MKKKKILVFHHSGAIGGGGVSMMHILQNISRKKYDIKVYCPLENGHMINAVKEIDIETSDDFQKEYVYPHFNGKTYCIFDLRFIKQIAYINKSKNKIKKILQNEEPDILILNSYTLFWIGKIAKQLGIKTVCFYRETLPKGKPFRNYYIKSQLKRNMDRLCYISNYDKNIVGDKVKSFVIYDRVDAGSYLKRYWEDVRREIGLDIDSKYILFMGGMWRVKGTHVIIEALKDVEAKLLMLQYKPEDKTPRNLRKIQGIKNKIRFIMGMDYESKVINLINKYKLWNKIEFLDGRQDIWAMYDVCDVVVFPSTLPHQSRPMYEAGIAKIPFIITDFPNTREFAKDNYNVYTFKNGDSRQLAEKINKCLYSDNTVITKNNYNESMNKHLLSTLKDDINNMLNGL